MKNAFTPSRIVTWWLYSGIVLILIMVVIGGMTRLTHSGLSMVHWSFTGSLPPLTDEAWHVEFQRYQASPEFIELHNHFSLSDFKSIFWWEYIHRMFGRFIGIVFIIPFLIFLWRKKIPRAMLPQFLTILGLGAFQALLGWFMVKSGLIDVPRVSHYRLAAHLSTAFITCAYIFWVCLNYQQFGTQERSKHPLFAWAAGLWMIILVQIVFGGFVAGLKAGWVHNTWPKMDGHWIAPSVTALDPVWINFLEGMSGVQFAHRTLAYIIAAVCLWILWKWKSTKSPRVDGPVVMVGCAIAIQILLGIFTLVLQVPIALAVVHQVFALITLLSATWLLHRTWFQPSSLASEDASIQRTDEIK